VESVAWVTERKDVLYTLFYLSALIFYIRYVDSDRRKKGFYWMALILFLLSCFTKSAAVTFPLVVVLIDWYRRRPFTRGIVWEKISFVVIAMVFGIVSLFSQEVTGTLSVEGNDFSLYQRPLLAAYALMFYFINCAVPIHLSAFHPFERSATGLLPWLYYAAPAPLLIGGYVLWKIRDIKPEIVFGVMFFIAAIVLNLHFVPVGAAIAAERYVYIPYIGLYFLIGYLVCYALDKNIFSINRRKKVVATIGMIIVLLLSYQTFQRVGAWKDTIALFTDAEIVDGKTAIGDKMLAGAYTYRGEAMLDGGDIQGAMQDLSTAISLYPEFHRALYSLGVAKYRLGDAKNALVDYTNAIAVSSNISIYYNERGNARMSLHDLDSAIVDYTKAIDINPKLAEAYANRARAYFILAKQEECCRDLMKADSLGYEDAARLLKEHCR
jgi:tetratricopeptide (TPR) repeat protein